MSPYAILGSRVGTAAAAALCLRLTAWHDVMVAHERRLRASRTSDACHDECPHVDARALWTEALATLGPVASELTFLRSRATAASPSPRAGLTIASLPAHAARPTRTGADARPGPRSDSTEARQIAHELLDSKDALSVRS